MRKQTVNSPAGLGRQTCIHVQCNMHVSLFFTSCAHADHPYGPSRGRARLLNTVQFMSDDPKRTSTSKTSPRAKPVFRLILPTYCVLSTFYLLNTRHPEESAGVAGENFVFNAYRVEQGMINISDSTATQITLESIVYSSQVGPNISVWPISFSAPETMWVSVVPVKILDFATLIPGNSSTYTYDEEAAYYEGYR